MNKGAFWSFLLAVLAAGVVIFAFAKVFTEKNARMMLGGDIEISRQGKTAPLAIGTFLGMYSHKKSETLEVRHTARLANKELAGNPDLMVSVTLKAIDRHYPLYGKLELEDRKNAKGVFTSKRKDAFGSVVSQSFLDQMEIGLGESFIIGGRKFIANAVIKREPDYKPGEDGDTPRVIITNHAFKSVLRKSGVRQDTTFSYRVKLNKKKTIDEWKKSFRRQFRDSAWKIRDWRELAPASIVYTSWTTIYVLLIAVFGLLIWSIIRNISRAKA